MASPRLGLVPHYSFAVFILCRGLHSTQLPALVSADIALASVYTRSASFRSSRPPHTARSRKLSEPGIQYSPLRGRKSSYADIGTSRERDGSDSDEGRHDAIENFVPQRGRTQSFLPVGNQVAKQKRKMSISEFQSDNEVCDKAASAASANSKARTCRPAYM